MTTDHLRRAREQLEDAIDTTDDHAVKEDVEETMVAFDAVVDGERAVDHTVIDSHLNALRQAAQRAETDAEGHIDHALEHAEEYRKTLDQA